MGGIIDKVLGSLSVGTQVAETVTGIVDGVGSTLQKLGIVELNDQQKDAIKDAVHGRVLKGNEQVIKVYQEETKDIQSARATQVSILKDAPKWIKAAAALVVPFGGYMAISVFFFNILAPNLGFERITLTGHETYTIDGIIVFFFGYRCIQKIKGVAGKF